MKEHFESDRQAHREREREKLRKFRQEMILKKRNNACSGDGKTTILFNYLLLDMNAGR